MSNSSGNSGSSLLDFLIRLFSRSAPQQPAPAPAVEPPQPNQPSTTPDNTIEVAHMVTARVLLVIYDPIMEPASGKKLSQVMNWKRPDDLANAFIQDIMQASGGMARYQVVQRVELNEFPVLADGYRYDPATYLKVQNRILPPHQPTAVDFQLILASLNLLPRVARNEVDEVWIFNFPYGGFPESIMGGKGAFWCNSAPLANTANCYRRFIIMGFSYERGGGEMLESFGHRCESLLAQAFKCQEFVAWAYRQGRLPATVGPDLNLFQQFLCFDQIAPGKAGVGSIHYAPNSTRDYEWNNPRLVTSNCYGWYDFPSFQNDVRKVNATEWGNGDLYLHHMWWLKHLPKVAGKTGGLFNNWWQYIMDPNLVNL